MATDTKNKNEGALSSLSSYYNTIKSGDDMPKPAMISSLGSSPMLLQFKTKVGNCANDLKEKCYKHILVDMYCKILPLDADYIDGNQDTMQSDVDNMLSAKGTTATQYLKSCTESTNAPLLEFITRSVNNIGKQFTEAENKKADSAAEEGIKLPDPEAPDVEDKEVNSQLIDIKQDPEYTSFIDKLKEKTINKIVTDVSNIINDKKKENAIKFDIKNPQSISDQVLANESTVSIPLQYLQRKAYNEGVEVTNDIMDDMMGIAIREATLNQFDTVFNQPRNTFREYVTRIRMGKGFVANESVVLTEDVNSTSSNNDKKDPTIKEVDGKKYDVDNFSSIDKDGVRKPLNDAEAKKVLGPEEYKNYQNRNNK